MLIFSHIEDNMNTITNGCIDSTVRLANGRYS